MKSILIIFCLFIVDSAFAQHFFEAYNAPGDSSAKANHIKTMQVYIYNKDDDSVLLRLNSYNVNGRKTSSYGFTRKGQQNSSDTSIFNEQDQLVKNISGFGNSFGTAVYTYGPGNKVSHVTFLNNDTISGNAVYTYNNNGDLDSTKVSLKMAGFCSKNYYSENRVLEKTVRNDNNPGATTTIFMHDAAGRLIQIIKENYSSRTVKSYFFNDNGLCSAEKTTIYHGADISFEGSAEFKYYADGLIYEIRWFEKKKLKEIQRSFYTFYQDLRPGL